jgi:L-ascorbate metabolism protein UlaG (beta-lactamase superfamily)
VWRSRSIRAGIVGAAVLGVAVVVALAARQPESPSPEPAAAPAAPSQGESSFPPASPPPPIAARGGNRAPHIARSPPAATGLPPSPAPLPADHPPIETSPDEASQVSIQWMGEAEFLIDSPGQTVVITDPFDPTRTAYGRATLHAHLVTVSDGLPDAAAVDLIQPFVDLGQKEVRLVRGAGTRQGDVTIRPVPSRSRQGAPGSNTIYLIQAGSLRIAHLGSLGERLSPAQIAALGRVDVLLAPVGGGATLGPEEAVDITRALNPRLVIPMRFRTPATDPAIRDRLRPVDDFTTKFVSVEFKDDYVALLAPNMLPRQTTVWVLKYRQETE